MALSNVANDQELENLLEAVINRLGDKSTGLPGLTANYLLRSSVAGKVEVSSLTESQVLDAINNIPSELNDLDDVNTTSGPTAKDVLEHDGNEFVPVKKVFDKVSNVVSNNTGDLANDNFVFGSDQLDDDTNIDHDSRMIFNKGLSSFRAGTVEGSQWDQSNTGFYSVAFGKNTEASGTHSFALGFNSDASGAYSVSMGFSTLASGTSSFAIGENAEATDLQSIAIGADASSTATRAMALQGGSATYSNALAIGSSTSNARLAVSTGQSVARACYCMTLGRYNIQEGDQNLWIDTDPIFTIGNGTDDSNRNNALSILKNGEIEIGSNTNQVVLRSNNGKFEIKNYGESFSKVLATPKVVYVSSESDFPTAVSGVITLEVNTKYVIIGNITTANRFVIPDAGGVTIEGYSLGASSLTSTNVGNMFTSITLSSFFSFTNILVSCPSGTLFNLDGNKDRSSRVVIFSSAFTNCSALGTVTNIGYTHELGAYFDCGTGITFDNNHELSLNCIFEDWKNQTTTFMTFLNDIPKIYISGLNSQLKSNETLYNIDSGMTTISAIVTTTVNDISLGGSIFAAGSKDYKDIDWIFVNNGNITDSTAIIGIKVDDNTQVTTVAATNTFTIIDATSFLDCPECETQRFTLDSNGVTRYDGKEKASISTTINASIQNQAGVVQNIGVQMGHIKNNTSYTVTFDNTTNIVNEVGTALSNGDQVSFYNTPGTLPAELRKDVFYYVVNKTTDTFQLSYTEGGAAIAFTDNGTPANNYSIARMIGSSAIGATAGNQDPISTTSLGLLDIIQNDQIVAMCVDETSVQDLLINKCYIQIYKI